MDTIFEQIVSIKKSRKTIILYFFIWIGALALEVLALLLFMSGQALAFLLMVAIVYAAYKLSSTLNIEYEYIITNNIMDVDKIINKSMRKRILSFDLGRVTRMEAYNDGLLKNIDIKDVVFACNTTDSNVYLLAYEQGAKQVYLVFTVSEKMQKALEKFLPKFISNSLFK